MEIEVWDNKDPRTKMQYPYEIVIVHESESISIALCFSQKYADYIKESLEALSAEEWTQKLV